MSKLIISPTATLHDIKTIPELFAALASGRKTVEMRVNDRGYKVKDVLLQREYCSSTRSYTGRTLLQLVTHMIDGGNWGVEPRWVAMSVRTIPDDTEVPGQK